jgi:hypothetical protein
VESNDRRGVPRYPFIVNIEVTDFQSGTQIKARTRNLSLFGCGIDTLKSFPTGTKVKVELSHGDEYMMAEARVAYASTTSGMGVVFFDIAAEYERILDRWIVQLSTTNRTN